MNGENFLINSLSLFLQNLPLEDILTVHFCYSLFFLCLNFYIFFISLHMPNLYYAFITQVNSLSVFLFLSFSRIYLWKIFSLCIFVIPFFFLCLNFYIFFISLHMPNLYYAYITQVALSLLIKLLFKYNFCCI